MIILYIFIKKALVKQAGSDYYIATSNNAPDNFKVKKMFYSNNPYSSNNPSPSGHEELTAVSIKSFN